MKELEESLLALRSGEVEAVDRLCRALAPRTESYVRRRLSARTRRWVEVEDVVQGVLQEVVRGLDDLPRDSGPEELVRRMQRIAMCRIRDAARNHRRLAGMSAGPDPLGIPAPGSRSTGPVTAEDRRRLLEEVVSRLPEKYASVVRLCGLEGLSYVEAGKRLGIGADAVRKRFEKARESLAMRLGSRDQV